jgi:O-antigen/teichoic acid export membrane protein
MKFSNPFVNIIGKLFGRGLNFLLNILLARIVLNGEDFGKFALYYSFFRLISYFLSINVGILYFQEFKTKWENGFFLLKPFYFVFLNIFILYLISFAFSFQDYIHIINASATFALIRGLIDFTRTSGKIVISVMFEEVILNMLIFTLLIFPKPISVDFIFEWITFAHLLVLLLLIVYYYKYLKFTKIDLSFEVSSLKKDYFNLLSLTFIRGESFLTGYLFREMGSKIYGLTAIGQVHILLMIVSTIHFFFQSYLVGIQNDIFESLKTGTLMKLYRKTQSTFLKFTLYTFVLVVLFYLFNKYYFIIVFNVSELVFVILNIVILAFLSQKVTFLTYLNKLRYLNLNILLLSFFVFLFLVIPMYVSINLLIWVTIILNTNIFITSLLNINNQINRTI